MAPLVPLNPWPHLYWRTEPSHACLRPLLSPSPRLAPGPMIRMGRSHMRSVVASVHTNWRSWMLSCEVGCCECVSHPSVHWCVLDWHTYNFLNRHRDLRSCSVWCVIGLLSSLHYHFPLGWATERPTPGGTRNQDPHSTQSVQLRGMQAQMSTHGTDAGRCSPGAFCQRLWPSTGVSLQPRHFTHGHGVCAASAAGTRHHAGHGCAASVQLSHRH